VDGEDQECLGARSADIQHASGFRAHPLIPVIQNVSVGFALPKTLGQYNDHSRELAPLDRVDRAERKRCWGILFGRLPGRLLRCLQEAAETSVILRGNAGRPGYFLHIVADLLGVSPGSASSGVQAGSETVRRVTEPTLVKCGLILVINACGVP
jgi:hypothetical protein